MREARLVKSRTSREMARAGSSETDRFPVVNPRHWGRWWLWLYLALLMAWVVITGGLYAAIAGIVAGLATFAFFAWKARRSFGSPEKNFVQLGKNEVRIKVYGWLSLKVAYGEIVHVRAATHLSMLERAVWAISKGQVPSYLEIGLSRPRLLHHLGFPWRFKRVFLKPVDLPQLELALQARLDRFARRQSETRL